MSSACTRTSERYHDAGVRLGLQGKNVLICHEEDGTAQHALSERWEQIRELFDLWHIPV